MWAGIFLCEARVYMAGCVGGGLVGARPFSTKGLPLLFLSGVSWSEDGPPHHPGAFPFLVVLVAFQTDVAECTRGGGTPSPVPVDANRGP